MKSKLFGIVFLAVFGYAESLSNYLDYLSNELRGQEPAESQSSRPEDIVPEEYFGLTNPMANNWPGSKHEKYGGYLKKIASEESDSSALPAANAWKTEASASSSPKQGSYLDSLSES